MHSKALLLFSLALGVAVSQDFEQGDFPSQCNDSCGAVATASDTCDQQNNNDDQAQVQCVCDTQNMATLLPNCITCLSQYRNTEDYNQGYQDAQQLLSACGFAAPTMSGPALTSTVYTTTRTTTDNDGEVDTDTDEVTSFYTTSGSGGAATPTSTVVTTTDSDGETTLITSTPSPSPTTNGGGAQTASSSSSPNAAAITAAPLMGAAAGIMAAMVAL